MKIHPQLLSLSLMLLADGHTNPDICILVTSFVEVIESCYDQSVLYVKLLFLGVPLCHI